VVALTPHSRDVVQRAFSASLDAVGYPATVIAFVVLCFVGWATYRYTTVGVDEVWADIRKAIVGVAICILAWLPFFGFHVLRVAEQDYEAMVARADRAESDLNDLKTKQSAPREAKEKAPSNEPELQRLRKEIGDLQSRLDDRAVQAAREKQLQLFRSRVAAQYTKGKDLEKHFEERRMVTANAEAWQHETAAILREYDPTFVIQFDKPAITHSVPLHLDMGSPEMRWWRHIHHKTEYLRDLLSRLEASR
jgi:hypothetical protein